MGELASRLLEGLSRLHDTLLGIARMTSSLANRGQKISQ